jgi:hypothetical protein
MLLWSDPIGIGILRIVEISIASDNRYNGSG